MKTKKGSQIYQVLSGRNNVHLIHSGDEWILIDTGMSRFYEKLKGRLQKILPENARLTVFLTHTHYDHCQNARALKEDFNCRIIVPKNESAFLKYGRTPLPKGTNRLAKFMVFLGNSVAHSKTSFTPFDADEIIEEDKQWSDSVKIIQTPGHTLGSQSIIVDEELAFVGDAMFGIFRNSIFPPFADDVKIMIQSWEKLYKTGCETFYPGHGKKIDEALLHQEYLRYSEKLLST